MKCAELSGLMYRCIMANRRIGRINVTEEEVSKFVNTMIAVQQTHRTKKYIVVDEEFCDLAEYKIDSRLVKMCPPRGVYASEDVLAENVMVPEDPEAKATLTPNQFSIVQSGIMGAFKVSPSMVDMPAPRLFSPIGYSVYHDGGLHYDGAQLEEYPVKQCFTMFDAKYYNCDYKTEMEKFVLTLFSQIALR